MNKKKRNLIILLIVLVALIAVYYLLDQTPWKDDTELTEETTTEKETFEPLVDFERQDLESLKIKNADAELVFKTEDEIVETEATTTAETEEDETAEDEAAEDEETTEETTEAEPKIETHWRLVEPEIERGVNTTSIEAVASPLETLRVQRLVSDSPEELASYGLDEPQAEVIYTTRDGEDVKVFLGDELQSGKKYYAKREDEDRVVILGSSAKACLSKPTDLIAAELVDGKGGVVRSFNLERQKDDFQISAKLVKSPHLPDEEQLETAEKALNETNRVLTDDERALLTWQITEPILWQAEDSKVNPLIDEITGLKPNEWIEIAPDEETLASYGLDQPTIRYHYVISEDNEGEILLGQDQGDGQSVVIVRLRMLFSST